MATYLPGVIPFVPQTEVFTPDYKFLQDVLTTRQDRYDTAFKEINKLYGQVVYAPLSRQGNKEKRDQYANALTNSLKQVAGMDLSLAQNVETAQALFSPFYQDKSLVKDMYATKTFRKSQKDIEFLKNATNRDYYRQYWTDGEKYVNYMMEEFINGTDEDAAKFNVGKLKYQKNPDIFNRAMEILDESNLVAEQDHIVKDYIIKIKNGPALTNHQFEYIDENGEKQVGTQNLAMDYAVQALADDPRIQQGMSIKYEVQKYEFIRDNAQQYGGKYQAGLEFDKQELLKSKDEEIRKLAEVTTRLEGDEYALANWEKYKETYGIVTGSKEDEALMKKQYEVMLGSETKRRIENRVNTLYSPTSAEQNMSNKARIAFISRNMKVDFFNAANAYSSKGFSKTITVDQAQQKDKQIAWEKQKFNAKQIQDWNLKVMEMENDRLIAGGGNIVSDLLQNYNTQFNEHPGSPYQNVDGLIYEKLNSDMLETQDFMLQTIFKSYQESKGFREYLYSSKDPNSPGDGYFNVGTEDEPDYRSLPDAMEYLKDVENEDELFRIYRDIKSKWETFDPEAKVNSFIPLDELDFSQDVLNEMMGYYTQIDAAMSGVPGSPSHVLDVYNQDYATAFNYIIRSNPDSDVAQNSYSGYAFPVTNEYKAILEAEGITSALLNSPRDAKIPGTDILVWDYIENHAKEAGLTDGIYTDGKDPYYGEGNNDFYDLVNNSKLVRRSGEELYIATKNSISGQPVYDENGLMIQSGLDSMGAWLTYEWPNGPDLPGTDSNITFWEHPSFSNNGWEGPTNQLRQQVFSYDENQGWQFDDEKLRLLVVGKDGYYSQITSAINRTFKHPNAIPGGSVPYPTALTLAFPDQEFNFGSDMFSAFYSNTQVGPNLINDLNAQNNLEGLFHAYQNIGSGNAMILQGDYLTKSYGDKTESDGLANDFYRDVLLQKISDPNWLKDNILGLQWSQISPTTYVDDYDGETKNFSAYKITIPPKLINEYKDFKGSGDKTLESSSIFSENSITVLIRQDLDAMINEKHMVNQDQGLYEKIIRTNGEYSNTIGGGGTVKYYLDHNGQIVQSLTPYRWDNEAGGYVNDPNYTDQIIDPATLDDVVNLTTESLIINRNNNVNLRNGNVNLDYNTDGSGVYQQYPGGPYLVR